MLKLESQNPINEQNLNEKVCEVSFELTKKRNSKDKQNIFIDLSHAFEQNLKNVIASSSKSFAY